MCFVLTFRIVFADDAASEKIHKYGNSDRLYKYENALHKVLHVRPVQGIVTKSLMKNGARHVEATLETPKWGSF